MCRTARDRETPKEQSESSLLATGSHGALRPMSSSPGTADRVMLRHARPGSRAAAP